MSILRIDFLRAAAIAVLVVAGAGARADDQANSGFLGDDSVYAKLETVQLPDGQKGKRWVGPRANFANFQRVLVEDVALYPKPEPGPQVSQETLDQISKYLSSELKQKVGSVLVMAEQPGPGVLRMRTAVTGVLIKTEGLKPYELVPVAAVFSGLKAASGKRAEEVHVFVESQFLDSVSGELVAAGVRELPGRKLSGKKDQLGLEDMQDSLDHATDTASTTMAEFLGKGSAPQN